MGVRAELVTWLAADSDITDLVAAGPAISWHGFQRGDGCPGVALSMISPGEEWTHDGPDGLNQPRLRFDLRGEDPVVIDALARALTDKMHAGGETDAWRFHPASLEADREIDLGEQDGGRMLFQRQLEFMGYNEEI